MWERFKRIFRKSKHFSRRFLILDFLSGGRLMASLYKLHHCLGRATVNHSLMRHPELDLRHKRTEEEIYSDIGRNVNDAKGYLLRDVFQI